MIKDFNKVVNLFSLKDFDFHEIEGHEGGRNQIFICSKNDEKKFVLRVSSNGDRTENDYLAEHGAPVADVIIENIIDEFECAAREGEEVDYEDIESAVSHLLN